MALAEKVRISLKKETSKSYDIVIGEKLFPTIASDLAEKPLGSNYVLLTDSNLEKLYAKPLMDELKAKGIEVNLVVYKAGEVNKTRATKAMIERSEEHTSELQSHSFISYAVFCLKKKKK